MHDYQKIYMNGICTANGNGGPEFPVFYSFFILIRNIILFEEK